MVVEWVAKARCRLPAVKLQSPTLCKVLCRLAPRALKTAESKWLKRCSGLLVAPSIAPRRFSRALFSARLQRCTSQFAQEQQAGALNDARIKLLSGWSSGTPIELQPAHSNNRCSPGRAFSDGAVSQDRELEETPRDFGSSAPVCWQQSLRECRRIPNYCEIKHIDFCIFLQ